MNTSQIKDLKDTVELMNSEDYKERLIGEYLQLIIRIDGLRKRLLYLTKTTNHTEYDMLHEQYIFMQGYRDILIKRMEYEQVTISD